VALPSAVTLGSAALVLAAGVGLVAVTSLADEEPAHDSSRTTPSTSEPDPTSPTRTVAPRAPEKTKKPKPDRGQAVPKVFVEVYNNSGITGLAADTAVTLEGAGWSVAATDNWYGSIPDNTVYYPDGMRPAAEKLAKLLDYSRMRPAVSPMQFDRLTVIITSA
jgi:hypothetical protein